MEIAFNGLKLGIVLALLVGPVFFAILQTSLERGFTYGVLVSLGVWLSDVMYVTICYFGLVQFINDTQFKIYLAYAGGIILVLFGLYHVFVKSRRALKTSFELSHEKKTYRYIIKGFIINGLSPMVLIFWVGAISIASLDFGYTQGYEFFTFFLVVLLTVFTTDILKAYLADKLRRLVTQRLMTILNVTVGVCLLLFGLRLLMSATDFLV